jgi:hypothetical protein
MHGIHHNASCEGQMVEIMRRSKLAFVAFFAIATHDPAGTAWLTDSGTLGQ